MESEMSELTYIRYYEAPRRRSFGRRLMAMIALRRQRHALAEMDDHMLSDIGITRAQAHREASRSAWDVPRNWTL
jgi:uncharacterized protein YjiS (DUF1127 family)